jgi:hypothetical protein
MIPLSKGPFSFYANHTSWLNQIECWFSILSASALGSQLVDVKQLREAIDHYICAYNAQAAPLEWRQGEIKQQPLRDNAWRRASAVCAADDASKNRNKPATARL